MPKGEVQIGINQLVFKCPEISKYKETEGREILLLTVRTVLILSACVVDVEVV